MSTENTPQNAPPVQRIEVPIRDREGKEIERTSVELEKLDVRVRPRLIKESVLMYQANRRVGTHETKTRGQVAGSNKKPWRQKGTGRARAGTRKSPIWRGGGIIFGPHPRDYSYRLSKKMRSRALRSALFAKFRDGEVVVVDGLQVEKPQTKAIAGVLKSLGIQGSCLIGTEGFDRNLVLSTRNIPHVKIAPVREFNTLDVMTAKTILLTRGALARVLEPGDAPEPPGAPEPTGESEVKA